MRKFLFLLFMPFLFIDGCFFGTQEEVEDHLGEVLVAGEYINETQYGTYAVYVDLIVRDGILDEIIVDEDSTNYTQGEVGPWNETNWLDEKDSFIEYLQGREISEILNMQVQIDQDGIPNGGSDLVSGATQSSGRLLLAVKDALSKID